MGGGRAVEDARFPLGRRLLVFVGLFLLLVIPGSRIPLPGTLGGSAGVLASAVLAGWAALALDGIRPAGLGFHGRPVVLSRELLLGTLLGGVVGVAAVGLMAALGGVEFRAANATGLGVSALSALWFYAVPAAAEEALFRGYPLQALHRAWGAAAALVLTSVAFGLLHGANPGIGWLATVNIVLAGLFLGALFLRTGSLWWATGAHLGWNWVTGFGADMSVSGLDVADNPVLEALPRGPDWLSGGAFGPEGSLLGSVALAAAVSWVLTTRRLAPTRGIRERDMLAPCMGPASSDRDGGS